MRRILILLAGLALAGFGLSTRAASPPAGSGAEADPKLFRAGACAIDVAPIAFPVLINGGFLQSQATRLNDPVHAKCLVLDDGATRLAIVVVDTCMMPRELLDLAKELAQKKTGILTDRMLISATHTHSAPAAMGALGCPADVRYVATLPGRIAEAIERAAGNLEPARIGWNVIDDNDHTFCRRWIRRLDKMIEDPFGVRTVRANMHPGYQNPDVIGPAGPVDPALTVLSVQSRAGRPIAVLCNYSMHYYGSTPVSADYFGRFATAIAKQIGAEKVDPPFVGIMSQGTSGDQMWMDYGQPKKDPGLDAYAQGVARGAYLAYQGIAYHDWVPLAMAETTLELGRRLPDETRLKWARDVIARMGNRDLPSSLPEVYAKEAIFLHEKPKRAFKLQAVRIGDLGLTAIPNEVYASTGLKLKAQSPFDTTMNIELANGSEGYIPPPEQHVLGGYTTWPARTAGLEVQAEPRIVSTLLELLEKVAGKPRRPWRVLNGPYAQAVLASRPIAYWRLEDIQGPTAIDSSPSARHATFEDGIAFFLPGPSSSAFSTGKSINRAAHFAGGRLKAGVDGIGETYSVELWFWNGLPSEVRPIAGYLVSRGARGGDAAPADQLGIGGTQVAPRRLFFSHGNDNTKPTFAGKSEIEPKTWYHLALVRDRGRITVYLDGNREPEIVGDAGVVAVKDLTTLLIGGRKDGVANFEGKFDEIALYDRALTADEFVSHHGAARGPNRAGVGARFP